VFGLNLMQQSRCGLAYGLSLTKNRSPESTIANLAKMPKNSRRKPILVTLSLDASFAMYLCQQHGASLSPLVMAKS
jgi:hypothetical protein